MLEIRRARLNVRLRRNIVGFGGFYSRFSGGNPGALRVDVSLGLNAFEAQQNVTLLDVLAFFHRDRGDFAHAFPEHVRIGERLHFSAGRGDSRCQVLAEGGGLFER